MTSSYKKSRDSGSSYYTRSISLRTAQQEATDESCPEEKRQPPGQWYVGLGTTGLRHSAMGIVDSQNFGVVSIQDDLTKFGRLVQGLHPYSDHKLVKNVGDNNKVSFHDFTVSAPKSVSVLWSQADAGIKKSIEAAHYVAARVFLDFMSRKSYTRLGKGGIVKVPAPLRAVLFAHYSSREEDPQLHIHCVVFNVCELPDGKTGALETREMMGCTGAAATLYHATLAFEIRKLGFKIQNKSNIFEVVGVPHAVCLEFSRRRQKILAAVRHKLQDRQGRELYTDVLRASRALFHTTALQTRNQKSELPNDRLDAVWRARGVALGFTQAHVEALIQPERPAELLIDEALLQVGREAICVLTEKSSVFREPALVTALASELMGRASPAQIMHSVEMLKASELISNPLQFDDLQRARPVIMPGAEGERIFTTREMLVLEHHMLELAARRAFDHRLDVIEFPASLMAVQRSAALHVFSDENAVSVMLGATGSAKTLVIAAISRSYAQSGYAVMGLATTQCSAITLKEAAGLNNVQATAGWIKDIHRGVLAVCKKTLLVLDGAHTVSTREMAALLKIAASAGAKVVLVGGAPDPAAISAVSGAPLRLIAKQNGAFVLDIGQAQTSEAERRAVHDFFAGQAGQGLKVYSQQLHFHLDDGAAHAAMVSRWQRSRLAHPGQSHLLLAMDAKSVHELNIRAHAARQAAGELGGSLMLQTLGCRPGELAEVSVSDPVVFWRRDTPSGVVRRGEGTVVRIDGAVIHVQAGDDLVAIDTADEAWRHKRGGLALAHGYAATVLSSRALTVDRVWLKDALALRRTTSGIAMSRHREACEVHVDLRARYEAKMHRTPADQWHPLEQFSMEQCRAQMAQTWSAEQEKSAAVEFKAWEFMGTRVDAALEVRIQRVIDQKVQRIQEKAAQTLKGVSDRKQARPAARLRDKRLRRQPFVFPGNALGQVPGFNKGVESPAGPLRALCALRRKPQSLESLEDLMGPVAGSAPMLPMPFLRMPTPGRPGPQAAQQVIHQPIRQTVDRLPAEKIDENALPQEPGQGAMAFGPGGQPVVRARWPGDGTQAGEHSMPMGGSPGEDAWAVLDQTEPEPEPEPEEDPDQPQDAPC